MGRDRGGGGLIWVSLSLSRRVGREGTGTPEPNHAFLCDATFRAFPQLGLGVGLDWANDHFEAAHLDHLDCLAGFDVTSVGIDVNQDVTEAGFA